MVQLQWKTNMKALFYVLVEGSKRELLETPFEQPALIGPFKTKQGAKAFIYFAPRMKGLAHDPNDYEKLGREYKHILKHKKTVHYAS